MHVSSPAHLTQLYPQRLPLLHQTATRSACMQVADAVADANIGTWADLLADEAIAIEHESQADTVMASLLLLPPHLLHLHHWGDAMKK